MDNAPIFSFELFPPKTAEGMKKLGETVDALNALRPAYFSVTYGAGGSTRARTFATVDLLCEKGIAVAPHLACIGSSSEEIRQILTHYRAQGVRRIVALRGDLPSGMGLGDPGELHHADALVSFIRRETGDHFHIEVAAYPEVHPQAAGAERDLDYFQGKVAAGANGAITQYFYNADAYFDFLERCTRRGIEVPIVPGIMPITNFTQLARFSDACGAEIPRWLRKRLEDFGDDLEALRQFGQEVVFRLCERLLQGGAPGLHFYTMNRVQPSKAIWQALGI